jgi:hypothetical protein
MSKKDPGLGRLCQSLAFIWRVKSGGRNAVVLWARSMTLTRKHQPGFDFRGSKRQVELFHHDIFSVDPCYVKQPWYWDV